MKAKAKYLKNMITVEDKMIHPKNPCLLGLDEDGETVVVFFEEGTILSEVPEAVMQRIIDEACANLDEEDE
jgi:hypothetical protein